MSRYTPSWIFFVGISIILLDYVVHCQLLRPDVMDLGVYNPETKKYEKKENILGRDDHDLKPHTKKILGGDDHDLQPHTKKLLGGDDHDYKPHNKKLIGGDDHDYKPHHKSKKLLGRGDHDYKPHTKILLGGGDHDYRPHHKKLLGQDGHDYLPHTKKMLGTGDHDRRPHHKMMFGGDDHDYKPHRKILFGGDDHDYKPHHKKMLGSGDHDYRPHHKRQHVVISPHDYVSLHKKHPHMRKGAKNFKMIHLFNDFKKRFNRTFENHKEFLKRFNIFRHNMKKAATLQLNEKGTAKYGVTKFADLTALEFRTLLGFNVHLKPAVSTMQKAQIPADEAPTEFDWRDKNVVTPVKNQGMCGSCWAFSVTGNVEGQWALKHNKLYSLSEQELVDCDGTDKGCSGGLPENAYKAIEELGGLETETGYPYEAKDDKCQLDSNKIKVKVNGSLELPQDEELLKKWLYKNGPISIGINANALQFYVGGVSHPFKFLCNPEDIDHGMLIVGYGVHTTKYLHRKQPYWLIKNSWGEDWGEKGYYRVYRGDGTCGVNNMASSAVVP